MADVDLSERANLHKLLQEHVLNMGKHLTSLYDGEDLADSTQKMHENTKNLIDLFEKLSEGGSTDDFRKIWEKHMDLYEKYTKEVKNEGNASQFREELDMLSGDFGSTVSELLGSSAEEVSDKMREHINLTLDLVDAHAADDKAKELSIGAKASAQALGFAEAIIP